MAASRSVPLSYPIGLDWDEFVSLLAASFFGVDQPEFTLCRKDSRIFCEMVWIPLAAKDRLEKNGGCQNV